MEGQCGSVYVTPTASRVRSGQFSSSPRALSIVTPTSPNPPSSSSRILLCGGSMTDHHPYLVTCEVGWLNNSQFIKLFISEQDPLDPHSLTSVSHLKTLYFRTKEKMLNVHWALLTNVVDIVTFSANLLCKKIKSFAESVLPELSIFGCMAGSGKMLDFSFFSQQYFLPTFKRHFLLIL